MEVSPNALLEWSPCYDSTGHSIYVVFFLSIILFCVLNSFEKDAGKVKRVSIFFMIKISMVVLIAH